jgi:hypothetical protein
MVGDHRSRVRYLDFFSLFGMYGDIILPVFLSLFDTMLVNQVIIFLSGPLPS